MFQRLWDVLNKYKAELVVSSSVVDGGKYNRFHEISPCEYSEKPQMVQRVNSRVLV